MSRELSVTRYIAAPRAVVWQAYKDHMAEWFCPRPWRVSALDMDFRPGGRSFVEMESPEGQRFPNDGVFLEVVEGERVVATDAFTPGWQPAGPFILVVTTFADEGEGTRYTATARHWTEEALEQHKAMGFETGWGTVADQLAEVAERLAAR